MIASSMLVLLAIGQASAPSFDVLSSDGKLRTGAIESLSPDLSMTLGDGGKLVPGALVSLRRVSRAVPPWPREAHFELHNGDRLVGSPSGISDTLVPIKIGLVTTREGLIRAPLLSVGRIWFQSIDRLDRDKHAAIFAETRDTDSVVLSNGDIVNGTIATIDVTKDALVMEQGNQRRSIALSKTIAATFSTRLARNRLPTGPYAKAVFTNGTRITLTDVSIRDGVLSGKTLYRERVEVPVAELLALRIHQGSADYLSDVKPTHYQYRTYQGEQFNWRPDRDSRGRELQLQTANGIHTFEKGLSVHGECTLEYALDGKYQQFESTVGLDPHLGQRGSVELRVLVDGKEASVGNGKPLTLQNGLWQVNVDVRGGKTLTLKVLWGEGGHVGDHVNWGDARLIRNDGKKN